LPDRACLVRQVPGGGFPLPVVLAAGCISRATSLAILHSRIANDE
jgi:hypothetical protein